jgi:alcohol dehydrogenase
METMPRPDDGSPAQEFDFRAPTRLVVGAGTLGQLGELARELGGTRALVVSDPGIVAAGHTAAGLAALGRAGIETAVFSGFGENPTTTQVEAGTTVAREFRPDLLVGLGGGSSMDCAKGINFLLCCGGRMQDYHGRGRATVSLLPAIAVPTTAGTGSETQSFALITDAATGRKMACGDPRAAFRVAILDVLLTLTQPPRIAALTGIDALSHAVESLVSTAATPASRVFSREAWRLLARNLPDLFAGDRFAGGGGDVAARSAVQLGAAWAGLAIENAMLGAAHALANPLTATHGVVHGQAVGLMLPHVVRFNAATCGADRISTAACGADRVSTAACGADYADLLRDVGIETAPAVAGARLADWLADQRAAAGLAGTLRDLGIDAPDVPALAEAAAAQWTAGFNPRSVTVTDLAQLYDAAR